jgi:hypothetical protein
MKIETMEGGPIERKILAAMVMDTQVLGRISSRWDGRMFGSPWANQIGDFCVCHFRKYGVAPERGISTILESWAERRNGSDEDSIRLMERFLSGVFREYTQSGKDGVDYVLDLAGEYFNKVRLARVAETIQADLQAGELEKANSRIVGYNKVELGVGSRVDVLMDREAIHSWFDRKRDPLVEMVGGLGRFLSGQLERDSLIAFMGPDKSGKSYWLQEIAWQGVLQRRRVAFFEVGDMSEHQIGIRFMVRAAEHPYKAAEWPCLIKIPTDIRLAKREFRVEGSDETRVEYTSVVSFREREFTEPLDSSIAWEACREVINNKVKSKNSYLALSCHPNNSISVHGIRSVLESWEMGGFVPDIVCIDYADLLEPIDKRAEKRDQINETWKELRRMSQEKHCLVITATQSDADAYTRKTLDRRNFSEDKRKLAHVNGMIGINIFGEEKQKGVCRLNWVVLRDGEYSVSKCVHVAGCLSVANPAIVSVFDL